MQNNLKEKYYKNIVPEIVKEHSLPSVMDVPRILKVVVNAGVGSFKDNKDALASFSEELSALCGQKCYVRPARLSEAGFKIRKGETVGLAVTLRGNRMWSFLEKLSTIVLPRVRDFQGLNPKAFDKSGNYSIGIKEHTIFPEVNTNVTKGNRSLQVTLVTDKNNVELSKAVLVALGFPFRKGK